VRRECNTQLLELFWIFCRVPSCHTVLCTRVCCPFYSIVLALFHATRANLQSLLVDTEKNQSQKITDMGVSVKIGESPTKVVHKDGPGIRRAASTRFRVRGVVTAVEYCGLGIDPETGAIKFDLSGLPG